MKITEVMKQAQELQGRIKKQQEELASREFEASSGGGMATVVVNGKGEMLSIVLDPDIVDRKEIDMLQDLIAAAVNEALKKVQEAQQDQMADMMGGLGLKLPGIS